MIPVIRRLAAIADRILNQLQPPNHPPPTPTVADTITCALIEILCDDDHADAPYIAEHITNHLHRRYTITPK